MPKDTWRSSTLKYIRQRAAKDLAVGAAVSRRSGGDRNERMPRLNCRQKIVWELRDNHGEVVKVFEYGAKSIADEIVVALAVAGIGTYFVCPKKVSV